MTHPYTEAQAQSDWDSQASEMAAARWHLPHNIVKNARLTLLRKVFDAGYKHACSETATDEWTPLRKNDPIFPGDRIRVVYQAYGLNIITEGTVHHLDEYGDPETEEEGILGIRGDSDLATWYVIRAPKPSLPHNNGAVILPADGHEHITDDTGGTYLSMIYLANTNEWAGWDTDNQILDRIDPGQIIPGTWKAVN